MEDGAVTAKRPGVDETAPERVAIVVVHGVAAHPRYEFQDQASGLLCERLNAARQPGSAEWVADVLNPPNSIAPESDEPRPTISRIHRVGDTVHAPVHASFDVIEAYWSPIDKGKTNWFFVLRWILRSVFTPLNTTARYIASWQKQLFDYTYIGGSLALAFALFAVSLSYVWQSFSTILGVTGLIARNTPQSVLDTLNANVTTAGVPVKIVAWLVIGVIGAYLVTQAGIAIVTTIRQYRILKNDRRAFVARGMALLLPGAVGALLIYQMATVHFPLGTLGWKGVTFLVIVFASFELGRGILSDFLVGFFGDVQIYCTHDENSAFFDLRERIIDVTVDAIRRAISPSHNGGYTYDRVIVFAHSLGATIAMDAIIRLHQLKEQGGVRSEDFARLRAFLTLGASLEKTKYFFGLSTPSKSLSFGQWRNDVYGSLFTDDPHVLESPNGTSGIFWTNYWYFQDPICNRIESYRSYLRPGEMLSEGSAIRAERSTGADGSEGRVICRNEQGHKRMTLFHPMLHSDYFYDDWFWTSAHDESGALRHIGALDVIVGVVAGGATDRGCTGKTRV